MTLKEKLDELVWDKLSDEENKDFWFDREVEVYLGNYLNLKYQRKT